MKKLLVLAVVLVAASFASAALTDGLFMNVPMNEGAGNQISNQVGVLETATIVDLWSGNPVSSGGIWVDGKFGKAVNANWNTNGSGGLKAVFNTAADGSHDQASISVWVKFDQQPSPNDKNGLIMHGRRADGGNREIWLETYAGENCGWAYAGWGRAAVSPLTTIQDGSWHNIIITTNGNHVSTYLDGAFSNTDWSSGLRDIGSLTLFGDNNDYGGGVAAYVDELNMWNRVITAGEISTLQTSAVPEPATMTMLGLGVLALIRRK